MADQIKLPKGGGKRFLFLRSRYPVFIYQAFTWDMKGNKLYLEFHFSCGEIVYKPKSVIDFPKGILAEKMAKKRKQLIDHLVFNLGLIELISYWKATCSPVIDVKCGKLTATQIKWWKHLYFHGLGEMFYLNKIQTTESEFVNIKCAKLGRYLRNEQFKPKENKLLVPIGGGKDSLASIDLLSKLKDEKFYLLMNPTKAAKAAAKAAIKRQPGHTVFIKRKIDKKLLKLNAAGYLNGHTPFSAMLAFYTTLVSVVVNTKYSCLSNEASANEPTIIGTDINHQYSKTVEFENNYNAYLSKYINPHYEYLSLLRPLNEFQIVKIFSQNENNLFIFKSCNVGSKQDKWCCNCSKCLFVSILLSAHIGIDRTNQVFGASLLDKKILKKEFLELVGHAKTKPFECIGTIDEIRVAITLIQKREPHLFSKQYLLKFFAKKYPSSFASAAEIREIEDTFFKGHRLNSKFKKLVYEGYEEASR